MDDENEETVPNIPKDMPIIDEENVNEPGPSGSGVNRAENAAQTQNPPLVTNETVPDDDEAKNEATTAEQIPAEKRDLTTEILDWLGLDDLDSDEADEVFSVLNKTPEPEVFERMKLREQENSSLFKFELNGDKSISDYSEEEPSGSKQSNGHGPPEVKLEAVNDDESPTFKLEENNTFMTWLNPGDNQHKPFVKKEDVEKVLRELKTEFQDNNPQSQCPSETVEGGDEDSNTVKLEQNSPVGTWTNDAVAPEELEAAMETTQNTNDENGPKQDGNVIKQETNAENVIKQERNAENVIKQESNAETVIKQETNAENVIKQESNAETTAIKQELNPDSDIKQEINENNDVKQESAEMHSENVQARVGVIREVKNDIVQVPIAGTSRDVSTAGTSQYVPIAGTSWDMKPAFHMQIVGDTNDGLTGNNNNNNIPIETIVISDSDSDADDVALIPPVKRVRFDDGASTSRAVPQQQYITWEMVRDSMLNVLREQQQQPQNAGFTISAPAPLSFGNVRLGDNDIIPSTSHAPVSSVRLIAEEDEHKSNATILAVYSFPTPQQRRRSERPRILRRSRSSRVHTCSRSRTNSQSRSLHNNRDMGSGKCTSVQLSVTSSFSIDGEALNNAFHSGSAGNERRPSSKRRKQKLQEKQQLSLTAAPPPIHLDGGTDESTDTD